MNRRDAILALAALGLVPLPGRAQPAGLRRIGILDISNLEPGLGYLREGLRDLGYVEGKNIQIVMGSCCGKEPRHCSSGSLGTRQGGLRR